MSEEEIYSLTCQGEYKFLITRKYEAVKTSKGLYIYRVLMRNGMMICKQPIGVPLPK